MSSLVLPAAALAGLTILMYALTAGTATAALLRGRMAYRQALYTGVSPAPDWVERPRRNYNNLVEMPTLFYALVAIEIARGGGDALQLQLAWAYVGLRYAHSLAHALVNPLRARFALFTAGAVVLAVLWVRLVLSVL